VITPSSSLLRRFGLSLPLILALASTGGAQSIIRAATGLTGTYSFYDFNGLPLTSGDAVTSQLEGGLVYFEGAYYGRPGDAIVGDSFLFGTPALYNYVANQFETPVLTIQFSMGATGAAFNFASGLARTTFRAYRGNDLVAVIDNEITGYVISGTAGPNRNDPSLTRYWGFDFGDGTTFDRITISSIPNPGGGTGTIPAQPAGFGLDNLQVRGAVVTPEPGTMALSAAGLLAIGALLRRRVRGKR
jgi:hypothetical protein